MMRIFGAFHRRFSFSFRPICRVVHLQPKHLGVSYSSFQLGLHFGFGVLRPLTPDERKRMRAPKQSKKI